MISSERKNNSHFKNWVLFSKFWKSRLNSGRNWVQSFLQKVFRTLKVHFPSNEPNVQTKSWALFSQKLDLQWFQNLWLKRNWEKNLIQWFWQKPMSFENVGEVKKIRSWCHYKWNSPTMFTCNWKIFSSRALTIRLIDTIFPDFLEQAAQKKTIRVDRLVSNFYSS